MAQEAREAAADQPAAPAWMDKAQQEDFREICGMIDSIKSGRDFYRVMNLINGGRYGLADCIKIGGFSVTGVLKDRSKAQTKGSANFLAPEVYLGKESYTKSADLYSLGVVLYRLLNYGRNPFLPPFPQRYHAQDEAAAFEKRTAGPAPLLGGEPIGSVILRAVSDSERRFQTADEFLNALEQAARQTPDDVLNGKIGLARDRKVSCFEGRSYGAAGEICPAPLATAGRTIANKFVFLLPVILLLVGLAVYFIFLPNICDQEVSFFDWLFADPRNIIDIWQNPYAALAKAPVLMEIRMFWYIWLAGFTASLFFAGRQLNRRPAPTAVNAVLVQREPYFLACDIQNRLKAAQSHVSRDEFAPLLYAVKCLVERLSVESGFGCGNANVTACENSIAKQLQVLSELSVRVEQDNPTETAEHMRRAVKNVNDLLRRRTELKKK